MIEHLLINSFLIFGIHASTRDGMIFGFITKFVNRWIVRFFLWAYKDGKPNRIVVNHPDFPDILDYGVIDATEKAGNTTAIILKPLFDCPPCMASVWGIPFVLIQPLSIWSIVYIFALSGLNNIIIKTFK